MFSAFRGKLLEPLKGSIDKGSQAAGKKKRRKRGIIIMDFKKANISKIRKSVGKTVQGESIWTIGIRTT